MDREEQMLNFKINFLKDGIPELIGLEFYKDLEILKKMQTETENSMLVDHNKDKMPNHNPEKNELMESIDNF